jgi:hypothetical protein
MEREPLLHALLSNRKLVMRSKGFYDHDGGAAAERIIGHPRRVLYRRTRKGRGSLIGDKRQMRWLRRRTPSSGAKLSVSLFLRRQHRRKLARLGGSGTQPDL